MKTKVRITLSSIFVFILISITLAVFPDFLTTYFPSQFSKKETVSTSIKEKGTYHPNCLGQCPGGAANDNIIVDHEIIILSSNKITKFADWVAYKVTPANLNGPERKRNWAKDPHLDIKFTLIPGDYKGLSQDPFNFDRGHQAPLAHFKNHEKWYVVNYLSNITPQKKNLNRGAWRIVEGIERKLAKSHGEVYVMTGPYYDPNATLEGPLNKRVPYIIPTGYWKIISLKKGNEISTLGFLFAQDTPATANHCQHMKRISEIEKMSGLKFFEALENLHINENALFSDVGCADRL